MSVAKTGSARILFLCLGFWLPGARALAQSAPQFTAEVDRTEISLDESVALKLSVSAEGGLGGVEPAFTAQGFEVLNEYSQTYVQSYYENGRFGMRHTQSQTKVLRPKQAGELRISGIRVTVGGKTYTASDIIVRVGPAGPGTPPPRGYGGSGMGLRGGGKRPTGRPVLIRAELSKASAVKGEQVIVSYYLYARVKVFNLAASRFPTLGGFLKEDLEMPILGQRLDQESVILDGTRYQKALLVRYAAYPLQDGKLKVDSLGIKYNYYQPNTNDWDDEDGVFNFFQQMTPREGSTESEVVYVDVTPVPVAGRPASFTGGVGDFSVVSAVDKYEVRANEAIAYTLKVEGRGNLAGIGEPKAKWPDTVELYDSKGSAKAHKGGVGEKVFEFLLIPRQPGTIQLPAIEMGFYDPAKRAYYTKAVDPVEIRVTDPQPGTTPVRAASQTGSSLANAPVAPKNPKPLRPPGAPLALGLLSLERPALYALLTFALGSLLWLGLLAGRDLQGWVLAKTGKAGKRDARTQRTDALGKSMEELHRLAREATQGAAFQTVSEAYDLLCSVVFDSIDLAFALGARSMSRSQLKDALVGERGVAETVWTKIDGILNHAETVRFAGGGSAETSARQELRKWVEEADSVRRTLSRIA